MTTKYLTSSHKQPMTHISIHHRHTFTQGQGAAGCNKENCNISPSCLGSHMVAMDCGIGANICLCDAKLQQFHYPRKSGMVCPLDSFHGD